jgi:SAM-dependent methyltransferase
VQLLDVIDPATLFRDYPYVTGISETMAAHNAGYARTVVELLGLGPKDMVVEIASNDGSLLERFQQYGVRTLGVEPAANIARVARARGVETVDRFFDAAVGAEIRADRGAAGAVVANNVLAHVDEPRDFLAGCRALLAEDGLLVVEVPYLRDLMDRLEYDTIYHEHLCHFSISALLRLCAAAGLRACRVDRLQVHGGSLRLYASPAAGPHDPAVATMAAEEARAGLLDFATYEAFAVAVGENRRALRGLLEDIRARGRTIAGYGAPAKGNTLLNAGGIDSGLLPFTVDKNPLKVGRYTPGSHIPVLPVGAVLERQPDYLLLLAWNFADEIMEQQREYRRRGGRFVVPIPRPVVVEP